MNLGMIVGTVVSSRSSVGLENPVYLLVNKCNQRGEVKDDFVVALDLVGAGRGEMVLLTEGSPSRETPLTVNRPLDALVVGIVDIVDEDDHVVYRK